MFIMTMGIAGGIDRFSRALFLFRSISLSAVLLLLLDGHFCIGLKPQQSTFFAQRQANGIVLGSSRNGFDTVNIDNARRKLFRGMLGAAMASTVTNLSPSLSTAASITTLQNDHDSVRHPFVYSDAWTGTSMNIMSLEDATKSGRYTRDIDSGLCYWNMGKWPDPALRIPARPIDLALWSSSEVELEKLQLAAAILRDTARREGAVGLAAQQCGVDARMIFLSGSGGSGSRIWNNSNNSNRNDLVLVNPRIVARSPESRMKVWTEECLVLPPTFRATVLRDDWIDVEYDYSFEYRSQPDENSKHALSSGRSLTRFVKEQSRCLQHELDHDRGILITDHIGFDEMENDVMRYIEAAGHDGR